MPRPILFFIAVLALVYPTPLRGDDARIRAELQATFDQMGAAVLKGDRAAYLSHIDKSEPRFFAEQTHWSDELEKYRPAEFTITFGEGAPTLGDSRAEVPMLMSWKFTDGLKDNWGMDAKGRSVKFPTVVFVKRDGHWLYSGEKWKEISGPEAVCTVRFFAGSEKVAEDVLKAFPVSKAHDDEEFQRPIKEPQIIELFQSMDHLKATVYINMPDSYLGGWSEAGESIKFMDNYTRGISGWTEAFAHEYGHVATWELGPGARDTPWWVQEGVAELCAMKFRGPKAWERLDSSIKKRAAAGTLPAWSEITDYLTTAANLKQLAYTQGNHLMVHVTNRWKREGRNAWIRAMVEGKSLDEATKQAFGITFAELDAQWRESLKEPPKQAKADGPAEPADLRPQLTAVLRSMTAAVAAANQEGYLAQVARTDPVFLKEQQNWAKDLARIAPESIDIALDELPLKVEADGGAVGLLSMKWRMPKGKDRSIQFPARFVKGETGWLYAGEKWNVLEGPGSRVLYEDESLKDVAALVAEVMPEVRTHVHEGFELTEDKSITEHVQEVKLYTSMRHLQHSIYLSYTDGLSGWNEPGEAIKILSSPRTNKRTLRVLLAHEYGHVATFHLGPKSTDMPWWILEGVAELSSEEFSGNSGSNHRQMQRWAKSGGLVEWDKLADFHGEAANHQQNVYSQGHHMVSFVSTTFGRTGRNKWLRELSQGTSLADATDKTLGISFEELDRRWRDSLKPVEEEKKEEAPAK